MINAITLARDLIRINFCLRHSECNECIDNCDLGISAMSDFIDNRLNNTIDNYCMNHKCNDKDCKLSNGYYCMCNVYFLTYKDIRRECSNE